MPVKVDKVFDDGQVISSAILLAICRMANYIACPSCASRTRKVQSQPQVGAPWRISKSPPDKSTWYRAWTGPHLPIVEPMAARLSPEGATALTTRFMILWATPGRPKASGRTNTLSCYPRAISVADERECRSRQRLKLLHRCAIFPFWIRSQLVNRG